MRQTAFPGISVDSIEVKGKAKPKGGFGDIPATEDAVLENAVDRGFTRDFEPMKTAAEFSGDTVGDFLNNVESRAGPLMGTVELKYNLKVLAKPKITDSAALNKLSEATSERSISTRARLFARAKNPFEADFFAVTTPTEDRELSEVIGDVYDVSVIVEK